MEYTIPNFGQYGYVAPKSQFNWKAFWLFIIAVSIILGIVYRLSQKDKDSDNEKGKTIDSKDNTNPFQPQLA